MHVFCVSVHFVCQWIQKIWSRHFFFNFPLLLGVSMLLLFEAFTMPWALWSTYLLGTKKQLDMFGCYFSPFHWGETWKLGIGTFFVIMPALTLPSAQTILNTLALKHVSLGGNSLLSSCDFLYKSFFTSLHPLSETYIFVQAVLWMRNVFGGTEKLWPPAG